MQIIKGASYDQANRPLHYIEVVAAGGRIEFAYRYDDAPDDSAMAADTSDASVG